MQRRAHSNLWNIVACLFLQFGLGLASTWSEWWTYEGISGPDFWGLVNPEWGLCSKGRRQSPVNIETKQLLFDPSLKPLHMDKHRVNGVLVNSGHDVRLLVDEPGPNFVNVTGGPLTYQYRASEILFHWGSADSRGSEHAIDGTTFPLEIQILGYNSDLYGNLSQALYSSSGLVVIALLAQVGLTPNAEFDLIAQQLKEVRYKGRQQRLRHLSIHDLVPPTEDYVTYEGSLTQPGCQETVTWVVVNRPVYIGAEHLKILRDIMQGGEENPKASMGNNFRPTQPTNHRPVRTNINFHNPSKDCTMERQNYYKANVLEMS